MKRLSALLLSALLALGLLSGCQSAGETPSSAQPRADDEVVIAMGPTSEPAAGFDPAYGWGAGEHVHEPLIQSTLTVTNPDLTIGGDLATSWEASEDGLTWTVTIRDDVSFTDGEALTASDVAFTYNTVKAASSVNDFTMLDHAEAIDNTTVVFHMVTPYSIWPYTMAIVGILPEHAYDPATYGSHPIGSGRYTLVQWDRGQQVILEANPNYYGEAPKMRRVTILFMEEDAAFLAVQAGQVDLAYTSATYSDQSLAGYSLLSCESVDNRGINLPTEGNPVTSDLAVRRAINIGVDRQEMIDHILNGHGTPAYSVCDKLPWYEPASQVDYDPEEAAALLDEAGWVLGEDGVRVKDGVRAELNILYATGDSVRQALAADLAGQLAELGFACTIEGVGWDTAYDRALTEPLVWGWGAHTPMELYNLYHTMPGTGTALYSPYANPTVDAYMDQALASSDLEESYALWRKAQWDGTTGVTQAGDIPWVWLVNVNHLYWVRDGLQVAEQKIHPHGHGWSIVNNVDQWTWTSFS
ncbi:ABC transporter substrate-binding protein [uncultured Intestinimonas sp.]|uniref:ABC transporter substrate-binding protein n=1 Tax=uncultured Intestinimonas sp. TaxID=1689265 RepID=UPI0025F1F88D|nr:ABC transporter substrate-binding protein [uncultured Intestinimonas sp.]